MEWVSSFAPKGRAFVARGDRREPLEMYEPQMFKPQRGVRSIPNIAFVIFHVVAFEEFEVFLLECFGAVMFGLVGEIGANDVEIRIRNGKCGITSLPGEIRGARKSIVNPRRGEGFDVADNVRDGVVTVEGGEDMDVIGDSAGGAESAFAVREDAADVFIEAGLEFGRDEGEAIFGGEDEVEIESAEGLGHGTSQNRIVVTISGYRTPRCGST
jgi:hypothetical protein